MPVSASKTVLSISGGKHRLAIFLGDIGSCAISTYKNMASCAMEQNFGFLILMLWEGGVSCFFSSLVCLCVTGAAGSVRDSNRGEQRGGVTFGDDVKSTLGIGATLGSGSGRKHLGGGRTDRTVGGISGSS